MHRAFYLLLPMLAGASAAQAQSQTPWRVSEVSGDVRIAEGAQSRPATRGALLAHGSVIAGARSRAVLVRGQQFVVVSPNSRLRVGEAPANAPNGMVQVILDAGTAMFRVDRREVPHFRVQTPYLAAVVRGTVFTVAVTPSGGSVQVTRGAVDVATLDNGAHQLVRPGMIVTVGASDLYQLSVSGDGNRTIRSPQAPANGVTSRVPASPAASDHANRVATPVGEAPVRLGDVTNGLVRGEPAIAAIVAVGANRDRDTRSSPPDRGGPEDPNGNPGNGNPGNGNPGGGNGNPGNGNPGGGNGNPGGGNGNPGNGNPGNGGPGPGAPDGGIDGIDGNGGGGNPGPGGPGRGPGRPDDPRGGRDRADR